MLGCGRRMNERGAAGFDGMDWCCLNSGGVAKRHRQSIYQRQQWKKDVATTLGIKT